MNKAYEYYFRTLALVENYIIKENSLSKKEVDKRKDESYHSRTGQPVFDDKPALKAIKETEAFLNANSNLSNDSVKQITISIQALQEAIEKQDKKQVASLINKLSELTANAEYVSEDSEPVVEKIETRNALKVMDKAKQKLAEKNLTEESVIGIKTVLDLVNKLTVGTDQQKLDEAVEKLKKATDAAAYLIVNSNRLDFEDGYYEGDIENGMMHGNGVRYWNDGKRIEGKFDQSLPHGTCKYFIKDELVYEGEYTHGERTEGTYYNTDGSKYVGQLKNNYFHGEGTLYDTDGLPIYEGEWQFGKREGFGIYYLKGVKRYEGNWKDNQRQGSGKAFSRDNILLFDGVWNNNEQVSN